MLNMHQNLNIESNLYLTPTLVKFVSWVHSHDILTVDLLVRTDGQVDSQLVLSVVSSLINLHSN